MKKLTTEEFIQRAKEIHGDKYDYSRVEYKSSLVKVEIGCPEHGYFWQKASEHLRGCGCPKCIPTAQLTTEEFIEKARKVHGDKYNYSISIYVNCKSKIWIICNKYGHKFEQMAASHLNGSGCPYCAKIKDLLSREEFIEKAKKVHGNYYDYSKVIYNGVKNHITIICPKHGLFRQHAGSHLQGNECPECKREKQFLTTEEFVRRAREVHGDKYNYSLVIYKSARDYVNIICPRHGVFRQRAYIHLNGSGCIKCAKASKRSKGEKELFEYINSIYPRKIIKNSRNQLDNQLELDIYLPELKLALEYNGDYWHKLHEDRNPGYHENKRNQCIERGITLIEIWESKWKKNKDQIKLLIQEEIKKAESLV